MMSDAIRFCDTGAAPLPVRLVMVYSTVSWWGRSKFTFQATSSPT